MLDHIHIQNYRLFKNLKIDKLGQVNLIAGKNNTGKTALLEALRILESDKDGVGTVVNNIIFNRGGWQYENRDLEAYSSLFYKKEDTERNKICINTRRLGILKTMDGQILMFVDNNGINGSMDDSATAFGKAIGYINPKDSIFYISFNSDSITFIPHFDKIVLNSLDSEVVNILKIINPNISDYKVLAANKEIQIKHGETFSPIKEEGDGLKRLIIIAVGLVLSKDNILLIDEFEVGLHHSIQEQLWEIIFKYAKEWNIQVFATTHSQDTVKAFNYISSKEEYKNMGQYMRLQPSRKTGEIEALIYSQESLENSLDLNLETR
jgi:AAA15 family ATPase/GTPase